jgi:hypothetical protein
VPPPAVHQPARGERDGVERERLGARRRRLYATGTIRNGHARHAAQRLSPLHGFSNLRQDPLAIIEHHRIDGAAEKGRGVGGRRVSSHDDWHVRRKAPHPPRERKDLVGLERMHGRNSDYRRARPAHFPLDRAAEAQVRDGDPVATGLERSGDVLHAERFDAEERTEAESFVLGNRAEQEDVHGRGAKRNIRCPP